MTRSALASMHALVHKTKPGTARFRFWAPWLALLAAALAACSPTFNWREVRASDGAFVVALPDKPQRVTR
ncbi:MAG TPA: hypothetical protein VFR86_26785, partial [Burkholderiaceae bacterium]|nr:hypothetical protein [Burkholderiaceae bacterium]